MQDSDDSNEHQQQSPPRPKTSKKLTGAATYRTKFSSIWVSHYRVLFEVERSVNNLAERGGLCVIYTQSQSVFSSAQECSEYPRYVHTD